MSPRSEAKMGAPRMLPWVAPTTIQNRFECRWWLCSQYLDRSKPKREVVQRPHAYPLLHSYNTEFWLRTSAALPNAREELDSCGSAPGLRHPRNWRSTSSRAHLRSGLRWRRQLAARESMVGSNLFRM